MKRTELKRKTDRCAFHDWRPIQAVGTVEVDECGQCGKTREVRRRSPEASTRLTLKQGRGFAASKAQRDKVQVMGCASCGVGPSDSVTIDPAHVTARANGGCDDERCVIALCRVCHRAFDEGRLDLLAKLEPAYRREVAHAVMHLGLEGTRRRLAPSLYGRGRVARGEEAA